MVVERKVATTFGRQKEEEVDIDNHAASNNFSRSVFVCLLHNRIILPVSLLFTYLRKELLHNTFITVTIYEKPVPVLNSTEFIVSCLQNEFCSLIYQKIHSEQMVSVFKCVQESLLAIPGRFSGTQAVSQ